MQFWRLKFRRLEIPAIGNRVYTDKTRLRGLKTLLVRGGGHCLCRREFYSPGLFRLQIPAIGNRVYTDKTRLRGLKQNILSPRRRTLFV